MSRFQPFKGKFSRKSQQDWTHLEKKIIFYKCSKTKRMNHKDKVKLDVHTIVMHIKYFDMFNVSSIVNPSFIWWLN